MERVELSLQVPNGAGDLLIAILNVHAEKIYSGEKTFEFRKQLPKEIPRRIFLYEIERRAITGHVVVERTLSGAPEVVWKTTRERGTTKDRFFNYFGKRSFAHAFEITAALKYHSPVTMESLGDVGKSFFIPQNFFYLSRIQPLNDLLRERAFDEALKNVKRPFSLVRLSNDNVKLFVEMIQKHIHGSYLETGRQYGKKLVAIGSVEDDVEGILTRKKVVLEVRSANKLIGFCVLTDKFGGALKTGPTMFIEEFRNEGLGRQFRAQLHSIALITGHRKVYCTAPVTNKSAMGYLMASGYRIEAHLFRHYHHLHDEIVFGFSLTSGRTPPSERFRPNTPARTLSRLRGESPAVALFLQEEFGETYCKMPDGWGAKQVKEAVRQEPYSTLFKPRRIFLAADGNDIQAAVLCTYKRGGSAKLLLISRTAHVESLVDLVEYSGAEAFRELRAKLRKLYSLVPVSDVTLQNAVYGARYYSEGVLDRPYRASDDLLVLSKASDSIAERAP